MGNLLSAGICTLSLFRKQIHESKSLKLCDNKMYSTLVVDGTILVCNFDDQINNQLE